jgi:hypothetical protein
MIWLVGTFLSLLCAAFYAGFNPLVLKEKNTYTGQKVIYEYDSGKIVLYCGLSLLGSLTWPISVPSFCLYLAGKKFSKES